MTYTVSSGTLNSTIPYHTHAGQCIPAGYSVSLPRRELITSSIITMLSISRKVLRPIVCALQNFDRNFANLVAPPTEELINI